MDKHFDIHFYEYGQRGAGKEMLRTWIFIRRHSVIVEWSSLSLNLNLLKNISWILINFSISIREFNKSIKHFVIPLQAPLILPQSPWRLALAHMSPPGKTLLTPYLLNLLPRSIISTAITSLHCLSWVLLATHCADGIHGGLGKKTGTN